MPFLATFFDLDGVLIDSFDASAATLNEAALLRGRLPIPIQTLRSVFGQSSERVVEMFFPDWNVKELELFFGERFPLHEHLIQALPGATAVIDDLDARGILSAIITDTPSATIARSVLERLGITPHALVTAEDVAWPKPSPEMIFRACEVLDVEPWDVLVVGDSEFDRLAAAAAGAPFAGINGIGGNFTISSLNEVCTIVDGMFR